MKDALCDFVLLHTIIDVYRFLKNCQYKYKLMDSLMTSIHKQHKADFLNDGHYIRLNTISVSNTYSTQKNSRLVLIELWSKSLLFKDRKFHIYE